MVKEMSLPNLNRYFCKRTPSEDTFGHIFRGSETLELRELLAKKLLLREILVVNWSQSKMKNPTTNLNSSENLANE
ncbi:hypothetical protein Avbf_18076 [Armadillidium vulgare]|nr:hypothetical protein Avbf_18076 [Armadillidium vulgare]